MKTEIRRLLLDEGTDAILNQIQELCVNDSELVLKDQYAYWYGFWAKHSLTPMASGVLIVTEGTVDEYGKYYTIVQSRKFANYYCRVDSYQNSYGEIEHHKWAVVKPIEKTIMVFE